MVFHADDFRGSSPLSRGILHDLNSARVRRGIIPALAGNTGTRYTSHPLGPDHPRSRGEYTTAPPRGTARFGSSPLSRGIPVLEIMSVPAVGIIPALAGNTKAAPVDTRRGGGSSPLSRGIHYRDSWVCWCSGIIPALAGNTWTGGTIESKYTDHPRSRGEYTIEAAQENYDNGSSPLSRGILLTVTEKLIPERIIPALAGNTSSFAASSASASDHPRSRGEYPIKAIVCPAVTGSSPLSRGILDSTGSTCPTSRIIPALAGNTQRPRLRHQQRPDHPRSRGEYPRHMLIMFTFIGSSPLSRGIPPNSQQGCAPDRIIPALAGNTQESPCS